MTVPKGITDAHRPRALSLYVAGAGDFLFIRKAPVIFYVVGLVFSFLGIRLLGGRPHLSSVFVRAGFFGLAS